MGKQRTTGLPGTQLQPSVPDSVDWIVRLRDFDNATHRLECLERMLA